MPAPAALLGTAASNQWQSVPLHGNQGQPEAISGNQRHSEAISSNQWKSAAVGRLQPCLVLQRAHQENSARNPQSCAHMLCIGGGQRRAARLKSAQLDTEML